MASSGCPIVWGFPNRYSHRGLVRDLAWVDVHEVPTFRVSLERTFPSPDGRGMSLETVDDRFDALWDRVKDDYRVIAASMARSFISPSMSRFTAVASCVSVSASG